ncbi:MAG: hypothetical protein KC636_26300 [Myxococcales bacterium]|nr:hypothetical protein [Myxococcales bacterium]
MSSLSVVLRRALVFTGLTATGVVVFFWLHRPGDAARRRKPREAGQPVRVLEVAEYTAAPKAIGYGVVEAQRNWQGVAEVGGRVIEMNERLEVGRLVREGTTLFKIDPGSYELEKSKTEATVKAARAQIGELKAREASARANLKVEEKVLELARKDLERLQSLYAQGNVALLDVETAEREVLSAERSVLSIKNTLAELPASRKVLEANLEQYRAGVKGADLELTRTELVAPFTMRIREVNAIEGQAISAGQVLVIGDAVDVMEVPAQLPIASVTPLRGRGRRGARGDAAERGEEAAGASAETRGADGDGARDRGDAGDGAEADRVPEETGERDAGPPGEGAAAAGERPAAGEQPAEGGGGRRGPGRQIHATVRLKSQGLRASWPAEFRRFEGIDAATQTMGVIVQVSEPRRREDRSQPRLTPGMHVEVELRGAPQPGCKAIPMSALHDGVVWIVDDKERLELRPVEVAFAQEEFACVTGGLSVGERVVLTDIAPAVAGMALTPRVDESAAERLATAAAGEGEAAP